MNSWTEVDVLLISPQPKTRAELLQYSCQITLDPNTTHTQVLLSEGNRKAPLVKKKTALSMAPLQISGKVVGPEQKGSDWMLLLGGDEKWSGRFNNRYIR